MKNENNTYLYDKVLSKIYFTDETVQMSLYPYLFTVWIRGNYKVWGNKGNLVGVLENFKM